jgi:hypothetical protein
MAMVFIDHRSASCETPANDSCTQPVVAAGSRSKESMRPNSMKWERGPRRHDCALRPAAPPLFKCSRTHAVIVRCSIRFTHTACTMRSTYDPGVWI